MAERNNHNNQGEPTNVDLNPIFAKTRTNWDTVTQDSTKVNGFSADAATGGILEWDENFKPGTWLLSVLGHAGSFEAFLDNVSVGSVTGASTTLQGALVDTELSAIDHAENGYDLTVTGATERGSVSDEILHRYGRGYNFNGNGSDHYLRTTASLLDLTQPICGSTVLTFEENDTTNAYLFSLGSSNGIRIALVLNDDGSLEWFEDGATTEGQSATGIVSFGNDYRITWVRNISAGTLSVHVNGTEVINEVGVSAPSTSYDEFLIGTHPDQISGSFDGAIYEFRLWNSLVDQATLNAIVDPNNLQYRFTREGNETACWFMERPVKTNAFKDHSGNGNDLTETGTVSMKFGTEQKFGVSVGGFTTSNYLTQGSATIEGLDDTTHTLAMSFTMGDTTNQQKILHWENGTSDRTSLRVLAGGVVQYHLEGVTFGGSGDNTLPLGAAFSEGDEVTVHIAHDTVGKTVSWFTNGDSGSDTYTGTVTGASDSFAIGIANATGVEADPFTGVLTSLALWDKIADETEVNDWLDATVMTNRRHAPDSPVAAYHFDYYDVLADSAEHDFDLTAGGSLPTSIWSPSIGFGDGQDFDGSGDVFSVVDSSLGFTGDVGVAIRFAMDSAPGAEPKILLAYNDGNDLGATTAYAIYIDTDGGLKYSHRRGDASNEVKTIKASLATGEHTLMVWRDATGATISANLDGTLELDAVAYTSTVSPSGHTTLVIGGGTTTAGRSLDGKIYDARIVTRAFTTDEQTGYMAGTIDNLNPLGDEVAAWGFGTPATQFIRKEPTSDYTGNGHTLTATGTPTRTYSLSNGFGRDLDGTDDYYTANDPDDDLVLAGDVSVLLRARWDDVSVNEDLFVVQTAESNNDSNIRIATDNATNKLRFIVGDGATADVVSSNQVINGIGDFNAICSRDVDGDMVIRVNGVEETLASTVTPKTTGTFTVRIGAGSAGNNDWDGAIYDIIVLPRVPTAQEIVDYEAGTLTAANAPSDAIAAWGFEDNIHQDESVAAAGFSGANTVASITNVSVATSGEQTLKLTSDDAEITSVNMRRTGD